MIIVKTAKLAIYTKENVPFEIKEFELTEPKSGYAQVELIASGVCGTDIHIHTGRLPFKGPMVIGHEFVGKITNILKEDSEKYGLKEGDNVIVDIAIPCGKCKLCKEGDDANCVNMNVSNGGNPYEAPHFFGGYGEYNYSPVSNMIKIPEEINPTAACVFACPGPTAIHAFSLAEKAGCNIEKAETAIVQGTGPVGSFAIAYFAAMGIKNVIALTVNKTEASEKLAKELGATEVIDLNCITEAELNEHILSMTDSLGADVVFEASGNPKAVPTGMSLLRNRGVYMVPGQYSNSGGIEIQPQLITFKALHIIGSSQYSMCDVEKYLEFLQKNPKLQDIILSLATCYKIEDVNKAFDDAKARKNIKTLLVK